MEPNLYYYYIIITKFIIREHLFV